MRKLTTILLAVLILANFLVGCSKGQSEAKKPAYPTKDIEVVVPFAAGGGSSLTAQIFAQIIDEEDYLPVRMNLNYKPGGSCAVGMSYVAAKKGDPYTILLTMPNQLTTPMMGGVELSQADFTPIAIFGYQVQILAAKPDSKFKTLEDVIKYAKENPGKLTVGVATVAGSQHMVAESFAKKAGIKITSVPHAGSSEAVASLLGGHTDISVIMLNEAISLLEAKQINGLAIGSKERVAGVAAAVPTFIEQGIDFSFGVARGIVAPAGIPEEARQALGVAFKKVAESPRWKTEFVDKFAFTADPKYLDDAKAFYEKEEAIYREILLDLNLLKEKK